MKHYKLTKEYLIELIGMADLLESVLEDIGKNFQADDAATISFIFRQEFDRICGEEELERIRGDKI